jgi:hypothetical protein
MQAYLRGQLETNQDNNVDGQTDDLSQRRQDAKFGKEFFLKTFTPLRLRERYSEIWLRLCRAVSRW